MSSIVNKIKDAVHSDKDKDKHHDTTGTHATTGTHGHTHGATHGTHATDPIGTTGAGNTFGGDHTAISTGVIHATPMTGQTGTESASYAAGAYGTGPAPNTAGHHKSDALNKADPRVDSDLDGSRTVGGAGNPPIEGYGTTGTTGGLHGTTGGLQGTGATTGTTGLGSGHPGGYAGTGNTVTGYDDPQGVHGPHSSRIANTADPRVDSDRDHRGAPGVHGAHATHGVGATGTGVGATGTHGLGSGVAPGPAPNTAGPHKQDILNKADPRVDSDLDGSKTVGGNKTYGA